MFSPERHLPPPGQRGRPRCPPATHRRRQTAAPISTDTGNTVPKRANPVLGEWVNPRRERQTIPQGQISSPPKSVLTPTAKAHPNQAAIATAAETPGTTHRARPRSPFSQIFCQTTYTKNDIFALPPVRTLDDSHGRRAHCVKKLAFTRFFFTARPLCTNRLSVYCPRPPALPTRLQYDCNTIAQYSIPKRPPVVMPYTIQ